ncbi:aminotransferase class IV [Deinococcus sp. YIM 77859]|uniref:aminotransferase class IV n=1 Tax=Deinococcus sp. YIM 77859 TaxID=1540221 RepID=UPI000558D6BB|nr:aminotransferase class IV [Deinococcus sp. YIM 77859]
MRPLPPHLEQSAWLHGAAAFTTVRTRWGVPLLWTAHLARLTATCTWLGLPVPQGEPPALEPLPWGLLRLTATPEGLFWSHRCLQPGPRPFGGVRVQLTGVQVHPQLAAHKTANHLPYLLAGREAAQADAFEGWLTDGDGNLVDGGRTSPLVELQGRLVVPSGGLPGLTRAHFLRGQTFEERPVPVNALPHASRAWVCGSGVGVVPVREIVGDGWRVTLPVRWPDLRDPALVWPAPADPA